jgi:hypothetical protein
VVLQQGGQVEGVVTSDQKAEGRRQKAEGRGSRVGRGEGDNPKILPLSVGIGKMGIRPLGHSHSRYSFLIKGLGLGMGIVAGQGGRGVIPKIPMGSQVGNIRARQGRIDSPKIPPLRVGIGILA